MLIRNFFSGVIFFLIFLFPLTVNAQKQVDLDQAQAIDPDLYTGSYFRVGVGFSRASFNFDPRFDGLIVNPLKLSLDFGKRMNRKYGAYFNVYGNIMLKPITIGFYDQMLQWSHAGMNVGGIFYIGGTKSYISPEAGLGILVFEYEEDTFTTDYSTYGIGGTLKYGYDRHIAGNVFVGGQFYLSYAYTWDVDADVPANATSLVYGVGLNLKFGK